MVFVSASALSSTLVLIDSAVQSYQSLIDNIYPGVKVVVIDTAADGIAQITDLLDDCSQIKNLHIVSHGSLGELRLGSSRLNLMNLKQYSQQIRTWTKALAADAELWLYGCNVAAGEIGKIFVESIANLTGASVAASSTPTGSTKLGGNWEFEFQTGKLQSALPFDSVALQTYPFVLGTLDWSLIDWPAGLLGTQTYSNLNNTGVDITITTAADPGVAFVSVGGQPTPNDIASLQGGKVVAPEAFHFTINPTVRGEGVTLTVNFNQPLNNVFFEIFDIDKAIDWQDEVVVTGVNGATTVLPSFTLATSPSYSVIGNVLQGQSSASDTGANSAKGTAGVLFNSAITGFSIIFRDGPSAGINPSQHGIALLSNITFDDPGVIVSPISGNTTEAGGTATFTVALSNAPTDNVTVNFTSSDLTEGTVPASITFTPANWNIPQTVTVTGADDTLIDGDINYTIVTSITSNDLLYSTINPADVQVTNQDNDVPATAGVTVTPTSITTTEAGGTGSFDVVLNTQPTSNVTVTLEGVNAAEGTLSTTTLTFTAANWNQVQKVTVTGKDDTIVDGDVNYTIITTATSSDNNYNNIDVADVAVTNIDNDTPGVTVTPGSITTSETGTKGSFSVVLSTQPTSDVTIALTGLDATEGSLSTSTLTFTSANWNLAQTVEVTGQDDALVDGSVNYTITTTATSSDTNYNNIIVADVTVTNVDNDAPGITVTPTTITTTEAGGNGSFGVLLNTQPTSNVTVDLTGIDPTEGTLSVTTLTFTPINWNTLQTVVITGVDDILDDGDITYTINTNASSSDVNYNSISVADVTVTNQDNDVPVIGTPGFTLSPINGNTTEAGGTATFTIQLNSQPTVDVIVNLSSSDTTEGSVPSAVTFTSANWNTPQTITVTGVDDPIVDGNIPYTILTNVSTSDLEYQAINPDDISVINLDDDQIRPPSVTPPPVIPPDSNSNPPIPGTPPNTPIDSPNPPVCLPGLTLQGNRQKNQLNGTFRGDWISGFKGNDILHGYGCNDRVVGGRGKDRLFGDEGNDIVMGGSDNDRLFGNDGIDILMGGRGKDRLRGGADDDVLRGQQKRDLLHGGQGNDQLWGGLGWDLLRSGQGDDLLKGGRGHDRLRAGTGNDTLDGGLNRDRINGFAGDDVLFGRRGNDWLRGHRGNDVLNGGLSRDRMRGHQGKDLLRGGGGRDWLNGGLGNDILIGGGRRDVLTGGAGQDQYVYRSLKERGDRIVGFNSTQDVINLNRLAAQPAFRDVETIADLVKLNQVGTNTLVQIDVNGSAPNGLQTLATLENVALNDINSRNFLI